MDVSVHMTYQSKPVKISDVRNTYQKGDLFCVMQEGGKVQKFPLVNIFRIVEEWGGSDSQTVTEAGSFNPGPQ